MGELKNLKIWSDSDKIRYYIEDVKGRDVLVLTNDNEKLKFINSWSYFSTITADGLELRQSVEEFKRFLFRSAASIPFVSNGCRLMLIHPLNKAEIAVVWNVDKNNVEWLSYNELNGNPNIQVSAGFFSTVRTFSYNELRELYNMS